MQSKTIQLSKLRKSGQSLIVTVKKNIIDHLKLNPNDDVWVNITKAEMPGLVEYECVKCKYRFTQIKVEEPYCPACDCEDVNVIFQELQGR